MTQLNPGSVGFQAPIVLGSFNKPLLVCQVRKRQRISHPILNPSCVICKLRNRGGFQLPPSIPADPDQQHRAIELLGCFTQTSRLHKSKLQELEDLIGGLPRNKLVAQQWKYTLTRQTKKKPKQLPSGEPNHHINRIRETINFPQDEKVLSSCFSELEHIRRRYASDAIPSPQRMVKLISILGSCPMSEREAKRYIRALVLIQKERKSIEKRPPTIPTENLDDMYCASMLLGTYAFYGSIGTQKEKLVSLIGALPRTTNIAASWKKHVEAAIRKKKRREKAAAKALEDEAKREFRRQRRIMREQMEQKSLTLSASFHKNMDATQESNKSEQTALACTKTGEISLSSAHLSRATRFSRVCRFIGKLFAVTKGY